MNLARSILFVGWLYLWLALSGLIYAPLLAFDRKWGNAAGRLWTRATLFGLRFIVGAEVKFEGREHTPTGAAIIAAKHQSMLDTLVPFLMFRDPAIGMKVELMKAPVMGYYARRMKMIPIEREARSAALRSLLKAAREAASDGRQIVLFPEGTRLPPGEKTDYKPGVFAIYRDLGVPCVPVALDTGRIWAARGLMRRSGVATIRLLEPIPPGLSREVFMATLEERIETESRALLERRP